ncbi:MAG: radical SAM family RiPP maturation amino acid epimerase, partial [Waterburya sp.]
AFVQLELQNQEANRIKAKAGRSREKSIENEEQDAELPEQGTIACVTGFLFNMVDRSVKLISPCNASERWPDGYIVYDQGTFTNAENLKILLERMIDDNMPLTVRPQQLISFRPDLKYESLPNGFRLSNQLKSYNFQQAPYLKELGNLINKGDKTAQEIAVICESFGILPTLTFYHLNLMFEKGNLDEEPKLEEFIA